MESNHCTTANEVDEMKRMNEKRTKFKRIIGVD